MIERLQGRGIFLGIVGLIVLGHLLLSVFIFPWTRAVNHPVELTLGAHRDTQIYLGYADDEPPLRLVPLEKKTFVWTWGTELPARKDYDLQLRFVNDNTSVQLSEMYVYQLSPEVKSIKLPTAGLLLHERENVDTQRLRNDIFLILGNAGGSIDILEDYVIGEIPGVGKYILFTVTYYLLAIAGVGLIYFGLRFPYQVHEIYWNPQNRVNNLALWIFVILGVFVHLYLVMFSMPDFWPADSTSYAMKAVSLADAGTFDSGTHEYELNRMPGYPAFMALIFIIFDWSLHWVVRIQTLVYCVAMVCLVWSVRNWGKGWLIGLGAMLALVSPPAVWASRQIATESLFMSAWLFALACWFIAWRSDGMKRWAGCLAFTVFTVVAVSIRPNGILLLAFPGCLMVGAIWRWITTPRHVIDYDWTPKIVIIEIAIPFIAVGIFLGLWSWRNYESRGFARPTDLSPVVYANAPFYTGTFDIRSAKDKEMYNWFVSNRRLSGYAFHGWSVRNYLFRDITNQYSNITDASIGELYDEMLAFNKRHAELLPPQVSLAGRIRSANWGLWLPKGNAYSLDGFQQNYRVNTEFVTDQLEKDVRNNLRWATRNSGHSIKIEETLPFKLQEFFNKRVIIHYPIIYGFLVLMGICLFAMSVYFNMVHRCAIMMPFLLNLLLNIYFQYVVARYIQVLDFSLILGIVLCLGPLLFQKTPKFEEE